jgi:hypothetical protein
MRKTGLFLALLSVFSFAALASAAPTMSDVRFHAPTPGVPFYHFTAQLSFDEETTVHVKELTINGDRQRNFYFVPRGETIDHSRPHIRRRLAIAEAVRSPRPEASYTEPTFIGRVNWEPGQSYSVALTASLGERDADPVTLVTQARTALGTDVGYWNTEWAEYQSVVLTETAGLDRVNEPVEATIVYYADQITDPATEIRVVAFNHESGEHRVVPSQVVDVADVPKSELPMYNEEGEQKPATFMPSGSATVVFPADVPANSSAVYLIFYGNEDAQAPNVDSGLEITGDAPGLTIENEDYLLKLHDLTGMLDEVTLQAKPDHTFVHKKETNGAIQWNPGAYAPPRPWVHVSDWEPGKYDYEYEEARGPVTLRTRRWGQMPLMPEIAVSMEYEFYADVPYFKMRSSMHLRYDIDIQALRNAEIVFAREAFSEAAWWDPVTKQIETRRIVDAPDLTEWTMPEATPWLAFFDRDHGCGFGGVQLGYANSSLVGKPRTLNPYLYITTGPWIYWTRTLAYPFGSRNPQQLMRIPAGSVFLEEWAYVPFELGTTDQERFKQLEHWHARLANPLLVQLDDPMDMRMQVPEEIYIEPTKTGWEEDGGEH